MIRAALAALLVAAAAQAQVADRVEITLLGTGCENVGNTIHVVLNGEDLDSFTVDRTAGCTWRGPSPPFDLRTARFSLRLSGTRTQVRHVFGTANNQSVGRLQFTYVPYASVNLGVETRDGGDGWVNLGYVRHVSAPQAQDVEYDERGKLTAFSQHSIADVSFVAEELRLQLQPGDARTGLLVNPLLKKSKRAVFNDVQFVDALQRQARGGARSSAPNDAVAARKADEKIVRDSRLKRLEIKVP